MNEKTVAYELSAWVDNNERTIYWYFSHAGLVRDFLEKYRFRLSRVQVVALQVDDDTHSLASKVVQYNYELRRFD